MHLRRNWGAPRAASFADTMRHVLNPTAVSSASTESSAVHLVIRTLFHCDHVVYAQYCDRRLCGKLHDTSLLQYVSYLLVIVTRQANESHAFYAMLGMCKRCRDLLR